MVGGLAEALNIGSSIERRRVEMSYDISRRKSATLVALVVVAFASPMASSFAAPSQSNFCLRLCGRLFSPLFSRRRHGAVAHGAVRGRPSAMRGLQRRWLYSHAYENCMN